MIQKRHGLRGIGCELSFHLPFSKSEVLWLPLSIKWDLATCPKCATSTPIFLPMKETFWRPCIYCLAPILSPLDSSFKVAIDKRHVFRHIGCKPSSYLTLLQSASIKWSPLGLNLKVAIGKRYILRQIGCEPSSHLTLARSGDLKVISSHTKPPFHTTNVETLCYPVSLLNPSVRPYTPTLQSRLVNAISSVKLGVNLALASLFHKVKSFS